MPASHFNPMAYEKSLEDAGMDRTLAEAHAKGLADLHEDFIELRADFADLRNAFMEFRVEMVKDMGNLKFEIIKWMVGLWILQTSTTIAIVKVLIS